MENETSRPQIETLACPYSGCSLYAKEGMSNLNVRKIYDKDRIRYLRFHEKAASVKATVVADAPKPATAPAP